MIEWRKFLQTLSAALIGLIGTARTTSPQNLQRKTERAKKPIAQGPKTIATTLKFPMASKIRSVVTILWIGLFAGTLDIADNLIFNQLRGITPTMVFHYIASGLIGTQASRGGLLSTALGVAIH